MKTKKWKILSVLLCISMLAAAAGIGGPSKLLVKAESLSEEPQASMLVEKLGAGWSCVWNGASDIPNADFVEVVSTEQHNGNYALRIGHPEADTSYTLRRVVDVSEEGAYEWSAWLKRSGALEEGSAVYIKKGIDGAGGDIKGYSLAGQKDEEWFQVKNDNSATDMWINEGKPVCIEISVVCKAGTYLYLDDLNISKSGEANRAQLLTDGSFERWTCIRNEETAAAAEFLTQVKDEGSLTLDNTYLRIGNPDKATDLTLQLQAPIMAEDGNHALYTTCARIGGNGITEGSVIRIKDAIDAAGAGHVKEYPLHNLTSEWVWIDNSDDTTNNVWTTNCVIEIDVKCPAGGYLYLDDFVVLRNDNTSVYLNADSGFECIPVVNTVEDREKLLDYIQAYAGEKLPANNRNATETEMIENVITGIQDAKSYSDVAAAYDTAKECIDAFANEYKLNVGGKQIRQDDSTLRFVLEIDDYFYEYIESHYTNVEFGTMIARKDLYQGDLEYSDETKKLVEGKATTIKRVSTYKPDKYVLVNEGRDTTVYTCVVRKIPQEYWSCTIRARNYLKYEDAEGNTRYYYGEEVTGSYQEVLNVYREQGLVE